MVLPEDSTNPIVEALNRIAENQEDTNALLAKIGGHYDAIVPVMKRNQIRAEDMHKESENSFSNQVKGIFANS